MKKYLLLNNAYYHLAPGIIKPGIKMITEPGKLMYITPYETAHKFLRELSGIDIKIITDKTELELDIIDCNLNTIPYKPDYQEFVIQIGNSKDMQNLLTEANTVKEIRINSDYYTDGNLTRKAHDIYCIQIGD